MLRAAWQWCTRARGRPAAETNCAAECMHAVVWARMLASVLMCMFWNGIKKCDREQGEGNEGWHWREAAKRRAGTVGGVTWHGMFFAGYAEACFWRGGCLHADDAISLAGGRVFLCHRRAGPYQSVTAVRQFPPGPA